jgi:hypothetical protein
MCTSSGEGNFNKGKVLYCYGEVSMMVSPGLYCHSEVGTRATPSLFCTAKAGARMSVTPDLYQYGEVGASHLTSTNTARSERHT